MRILKIRLKNLNSIEGDWEIDLTNPEYVKEGIFAIVGPTGAGKSTLLDAICLGLYGRTPRLDGITQSNNNIMSTFTGECLAEITFEAAGVTYRANWAQRRARGQATGNLQCPKHELINVTESKLLDLKSNEVKHKIAEITGMDFERFTRSMLLAQGRFAEFLQASGDQRSALLQEITGTRIYEAISIQAHHRKGKEEEMLKLLKEQVKTVTLLSADELKAIQTLLVDLDKQQKTETKKLTELRKVHQWLQDVATKQDELSKAAEHEKQINDKKEAFATKAKTLKLAEKALELNAEFTSLASMREAQLNEDQRLTTKEQHLPSLQLGKKRALDQEKLATTELDKCKGAKKAAEPGLSALRLLIKSIADQQNVIEGLQLEKKSVSDTLSRTKADKDNEETRQKKLSSELALITDWMNSHKAYERLTSDFTGLCTQINGIAVEEEEIAKLPKRLEELSKQLEDRQTDEAKQKNQEDSLVKSLQINEKEIVANSKEQADVLNGSKVSDLRLRRDQAVELRANSTTIDNLKSKLAELEDGDACPLCGSTAHPYAEHTPKKPSEFDAEINALDVQLKKTDELVAAAQKLQETKTLLNNQLIQARATTKQIGSDIANLQKTIAELRAEYETKRSTFNVKKEKLLEEVEQYALPDLQDLTLEEVKQTLSTYLKQWLEKADSKGQLNSDLQNISVRVAGLISTLNSQKEQLAQLDKKLSIAQKALEEKEIERKAKFHNMDPEEESRKHELAIEQADKSLTEARETHQKCSDALRDANNQIDSLKESIEARKLKLVEQEGRFKTLLEAKGFEEESVYLAARLTDDELDALRVENNLLTQEMAAAKGALKSAKDRLDKTVEVKLTSKTLEEITLELAESEAKEKSISESILTAKNKLHEDTVKRGSVAQTQAKIEKQELELESWSILHKLIGSHDGKKFRDFAQGLTFEIMIGHANEQLQRISDRYILIRDAECPLDINVIDNYQAGEIRTTRNLSGGESFIVSLALALGLSNMASDRVRVDSLFLDEGFGTLDGEILDTALQALAGLQHDGKLIGVISHVEALKAQIKTQINVIKQSGGKSIIEGPGCGKTQNNSEEANKKAAA